MACSCTRGEVASPVVRVLSGWPRRIAVILRLALPVAMLTLIPKCPGCIAAYVLLCTGVGVSLSAAATLRWAVIAISLAAIGGVLFGAARWVFPPPRSCGGRLRVR